jgi:hypothetical protein
LIKKYFWIIQGNKYFHFWQTSSILSSSKYATSVFVPNHGWFIFGGDGNTLLTSQKLQTLSGNWTAGGPNLYQNDFFNCGIQVSKTLFEKKMLLASSSCLM